MESVDGLPFAEWEPIYRSICADMGYDPGADERATEIVASWLETFAFDRASMHGEDVGVVVGADLDVSGLRQLRQVDSVVATGDALRRLSDGAIPVRIAVTDLDSDPPAVCARTRRGQIVAVHAHGDNVTQLETWLPRMATEHVIGTTQSRPVDPMINVGGFTDGDRAAYLAHALGAASLQFIGWKLDAHDVTPTKRSKLDWAIRLLIHLEEMRKERYPILDGHRDAVNSL